MERKDKGLKVSCLFRVLRGQGGLGNFWAHPSGSTIENERLSCAKAFLSSFTSASLLFRYAQKQTSQDCKSLETVVDEALKLTRYY